MMERILSNNLPAIGDLFILTVYYNERESNL